MIYDPETHPEYRAHRIENNRVARRWVGSAEVVEADQRGVTLTGSVYETTWKDAAPPEYTEDAGVSDVATIRLDVLGDSVVRVRVAEGDGLVENDTPMVVGAPAAPTGPVEVERREDAVVITTATTRLEIGLKPFRICASTLDGSVLCEVGAEASTPSNFGSVEKNHFQRWDTFPTGVCRTIEGAAPIAVECFTLRSHEAIYGFGEQFIKLDKVGQTIDVNMNEATGIGTPRSYKNVPFFVSTRGYGVFFNQSALMTAWIGSSHAASVQIAIEDDFLDYFLLFGSIKRILSSYTDVTGKGTLPPRWSFGFWQSKVSYQSADECREVVRKSREAGFPLDVIHLDTHWFREDWRCDLEFDEERFPDPRGWMTELADQGVKVSLWQLPYIPEGSSLYDELSAVGGFVEDEAGEDYDVGICHTGGFEGRVGCIDFTNPRAVEVYQSKLRKLFELGARAIKADFGEEAPTDGVYHDGTPGHRMRNLYPLLYNRAVAEVTERATGERLIWARSAWAGSQRYPVHWGGDSSCNWANLVPQITGGLSLGLSGFQFWSQDIGGFIGFTGGDLLVRWMQLGVFLSHARIHGMGPRELYTFDADVQRVCRKYLELRYRLLPFLWGVARDSVERSLPMARPLVVEYQDDPNTWRIGDQWLVGDSLLVAPITDPSNERDIYLPHGRWVDWWTGERLAGGRWIRREADIETLPLFLAEGAMVVMGPVMSHVDERPIDELTVRIAPRAEDGRSEVRVPLDDRREVTATYVTSGARHAVEVDGAGARVALDIVGAEAPEVELIVR